MSVAFGSQELLSFIELQSYHAFRMKRRFCFEEWLIYHFVDVQRQMCQTVEAFFDLHPLQLTIK